MTVHPINNDNLFEKGGSLSYSPFKNGGAPRDLLQCRHKDCSVLAEEKRKNVLLVRGKNKKMKVTPSKAKLRYSTQLSEDIRVRWKTDCDEEQGIVKVKISGLMSWDDKKKLCEEMLAAGRKKNISTFLVDQKETSFGLSVLEIDRLPEMFRNMGFEIKDRVAILINSDSSNNALFSFLQNVFTLSALRVQIFTDQGEATAWLKRQNK
jgi:hypothetical protein